MTKTLRICVLAVLLWTGTALAKDKVEAVVTAQDVDVFARQSEAVRAQMAKGGRYEYVHENERNTVERRLTEIEKLLAEHGPVKSMNDSQRVELFNAQEEVNAILTQRDSKRLICTRRPPTGSHVAENRCITYGERERIRSATERQLLDLERQGAPTPEMETRPGGL